MEPNYFDCVILGGGILGATCFHTLTTNGIKTLLIEKGRIGLMGATAHAGAVIRVSHFDQQVTQKAAFAFKFYSSLQKKHTRQVILEKKGYLHFCKQDYIDQILNQLKRQNIESMILSRNHLCKKFSSLGINADAAIFEPNSGYLNPQLTISLLIESGVSTNNGVVWQGVEAYSPVITNEKVQELLTSNGKIKTSSVVIALGSESINYLNKYNFASDGLWSQVIQASHFIGTPNLDKVPCYSDDELLIYGRSLPLTRGLLVGLPTGTLCTHNETNIIANTDHTKKTLSIAKKRFAWLSSAVSAGAWCHTDCYSINGDEGKVGKLTPNIDNLLIATGFSGSGFKMAPYASKIILDLIKQL